MAFCVAAGWAYAASAAATPGVDTGMIRCPRKNDETRMRNDEIPQTV
jgi:hypothetical protein